MTAQLRGVAAAACVIPCLLLPSLARATDIYVEMGAGVSQLRSAGSFFGRSLPQALGYGLGLQFTFGVALSPKRSTVGVDVAAQHRLSSGSADDTYFSIQVPYPVVRVTIGRTFFSLGVSPWVWARSRPDANVDFYGRSERSLAILGEVGYLWAITPAVAFIAGAAAQVIRTDGKYSPIPAIDLTAGLRFNFASPANFDSQRRGYWEGEDPSKYPGYRYPYGIELR